MNEFRQHIPGYCSGIEPFSLNFNTKEELLSNEWINNWTKHPFDLEEPNPEFLKFSLSNNRLICEFKSGKKWYVIGYIKHPELVDLPKWEPVREEKGNE